MGKIKGLLFGLILVLLIGGCGKQPTQSLRVVASPTPHTEILEQAASELKKQGIDLEIITVMDYYLPNRLVDEKEVDANFFQHEPFLDYQKNQQNLQLEILGKVHIEPMGIYGKTLSSHSDFTKNSVALPSDPSNQARALLLLETSGLITLKKDASPSVFSIVENPYELVWIEVDAALLPRLYDEVDLAVIPTNFALQIGLTPEKDALFLENRDSPYANIVVIHPHSSKKEALNKLIETLQSEKMETFLKEHYHGAILPAGKTP